MTKPLISVMVENASEEPPMPDFQNEEECRAWLTKKLQDSFRDMIAKPATMHDIKDEITKQIRKLREAGYLEFSGGQPEFAVEKDPDDPRVVIILPLNDEAREALALLYGKESR